MINYIIQAKNPQVLAITPLLPGHSISKETKIGLKRNDIEYSWISYTSNNNIPTNVTLALAAYEARAKIPPYVIIIDRDIDPSRNMLTALHRTLQYAPDDIAYCYCNFKFTGVVNAQFWDLQFDPMKLLSANYISSNSMIRYDKLLEVGGFVTDNKYKRLLDWALWLKFLSYGYHGILNNTVHFIAKSETTSVSAGTQLEYREKYALVYNDFVKPMLQGLIY
jgi:hypothetical protein